jgi:hypothetical protein
VHQQSKTLPMPSTSRLHTPMPMKTTFRMGESARACTSCSMISPDVRSPCKQLNLALENNVCHELHDHGNDHLTGSGHSAIVTLRPMVPVAQKVQPIWQPTSEDTHSVARLPPAVTQLSASLSPRPVSVTPVAMLHVDKKNMLHRAANPRT